MKIELKKNPQKYLKKVDTNTYNKLFRALEKLKNLDGDIEKIKTATNKYRLKIDHYRIIFTVDVENETIIIEEINTRTNIKY